MLRVSCFITSITPLLVCRAASSSWRSSGQPKRNSANARTGKIGMKFLFMTCGNRGELIYQTIAIKCKRAACGCDPKPRATSVSGRIFSTRDDSLHPLVRPASCNSHFSRVE
jgi:hypothetical protein